MLYHKSQQAPFVILCSYLCKRLFSILKLERHFVQKVLLDKLLTQGGIGLQLNDFSVLLVCYAVAQLQLPSTEFIDQVELCDCSFFSTCNVINVCYSCWNFSTDKQAEFTLFCRQLMGKYSCSYEDKNKPVRSWQVCAVIFHYCIVHRVACLTFIKNERIFSLLWL